MNWLANMILPWMLNWKSQKQSYQTTILVLSIEATSKFDWGLLSIMSWSANMILPGMLNWNSLIQSYPTTALMFLTTNVKFVHYKQLVGQSDVTADVELKETKTNSSNKDVGVIETNVAFWLKIVVNYELVGQYYFPTNVEFFKSTTFRILAKLSIVFLYLIIMWIVQYAVCQVNPTNKRIHE